MSESGAVKYFTDLECWKLGRKVRQEIYKVVRILPDEEKFDLAPQLRRAGVSITANIAEGFGRYHYQENIQFCRHSRGSLYETHDHLTTCLDENYIDKNKFDELTILIEQTAKTLNGYIRWLNKQKGKLVK
ncbi:MAG: four helix bundle protein [Ignavibacteriales bacterium]|nr:four helix bundle protein [Ignavibacteriales bacterium]